MEYFENAQADINIVEYFFWKIEQHKFSYDQYKEHTNFNNKLNQCKNKHPNNENYKNSLLNFKSSDETAFPWKNIKDPFIEHIEGLNFSHAKHIQPYSPADINIVEYFFWKIEQHKFSYDQYKEHTNFNNKLNQCKNKHPNNENYKNSLLNFKSSDETAFPWKNIKDPFIEHIEGLNFSHAKHIQPYSPVISYIIDDDIDGLFRLPFCTNFRPVQIISPKNSEKTLLINLAHKIGIKVSLEIYQFTKSKN
ncbi:hypothetical protein Glove_642g17 [Diversispora epigaea]|uniref:Uncharacterized protein n=1 Tax=Diversispora epigaea TaxID=1348612 RepID=A0A397G8G0_9GLOM|nr:hypothetical protein Glove_642g17 [Diversispora epigaea]